MICGWIDGWMAGWMDDYEQIDEYDDICMDDTCMDEWLRRLMNGQMMYVWIDEWMNGLYMIYCWLVDLIWLSQLGLKLKGQLDGLLNG